MKRKEFGQLLNLKEDYIPLRNKNRPGTPIFIQYITVHNTDNTDSGADALAHAKFVKDPGYYIYKEKKNWVSWHYTVDDKCVIKHLPINEVGWHSNREGNSKSIGIEICMHQGIDQEAANLRAARLIAALLYDLKLTLDRIVPHYKWTGKNCPSLLLDNGKPGSQWKNFISLVKQELSTIN
ncbi:MAG: N-acetylmuramoyl-L-alanine amidase [Nostocaceae cyanobacterium]|nr:N-acetylmuramoyl-L-alanine amidase [Nostocaceae cyanobacterium]